MSASWSQLPTTGSPLAVSSAAAVYEPNSDALLVVGGNASTDGLQFTPNNRLFALSLAGPNDD